jgi:nicotinamide-nucleotide amidase
MADDETEASAAERVGAALGAAGASVATAESCTGGLVSASLIAVPGASDYVEGGIVAYAYDLKRSLLGVSRESLDEAGAVSERVAVEMAAAARDRTDATWGVSTTGVSGPGGGDSVPVGTVWIGIAYAAPWGSGDSYAAATRYRFDGDRTAVREAATERALSDLDAAVRSAPHRPRDGQ